MYQLYSSRILLESVFQKDFPLSPHTKNDWKSNYKTSSNIAR